MQYRTNTLMQSFLALICLSCMTSCLSNSSALPSISGVSKESEPDLITAARDFQVCMSDAGLNVELAQDQSGSMTVVIFSGNDALMYRSQYGTATVVGPEDYYSTAEIEDFILAENTEIAMIVNGVDFSAKYERCLVESSYDENVAMLNQNSSSQQVSAQVTANNVWAECARENGFPSISDSSVNDDEPTILLPSSITENQLRELLKVCPNFDPKMHDDLAKGASVEYKPEPSITIDFKGQGGDWEEWQKLQGVLYEFAQEYWKSQEGS